MDNNVVEAQTAPPDRRVPRSRLLLQGESLIAVLGTAAAAIILSVAASGGWWALHASSDSALEARRGQVKSISQVLAQSSEAMLASDELSRLRRLIAETAQSQDLSLCRLTLPSGQIIADADPSKITLAVPPKQWSNGPLDAPAEASTTTISFDTPLIVPGRGVAILHIAASTPAPGTRRWDLAGGFGAIGVAALSMLLYVYRGVRRRIGVLGLIRESLLALQAGDKTRDTFSLAADLGPEALAWNALLAEAEQVRESSAAEHAKLMLARPREARSDLENACDSLAVGIILVDDTGRIRHANGAAAALLGVKRDKVQGSEFASLVQDKSVVSAVAAVSAGGGRRETIELPWGDGGKAGVLRVHVRPLRRQDGHGALVTLDDITQQRVADASRNSFIAQATHELRAPLTNMRLCLENALETDQQDPLMMAESFNVLNRETRRLERMVSEMLSVAEIEAGSLKLNVDDVKLDRMFSEIETDYRPFAAEKQIAMQFQLAPKMPEMSGDRDRLMLALHNLVGNAIKYTPAGGNVAVNMRLEADKMHVDVTDTGIGISEAELAPIFDRFYRAKDPRVEKITGSGLGLALAREVARLHGGDVTVQSELNKGSTFTLTLPLVAPVARANAA